MYMGVWEEEYVRGLWGRKGEREGCTPFLL